MSAASHRLLPISSHGSVGSGCLLSTSAGVTNQGQSIKSLLLGSSFAARVLALSQLCPLQCRWGEKDLTALQTRARVTNATRQCLWPTGDSESLEGARLQGM